MYLQELEITGKSLIAAELVLRFEKEVKFVGVKRYIPLWAMHGHIGPEEGQTAKCKVLYYSPANVNCVSGPRAWLTMHDAWVDVVITHGTHSHSFCSVMWVHVV